MSSFRLYLDTRSQRKDGSYPLKITVTHKRNFMLNLKVYTTPEYFIGGEVLIPGEPGRQKGVNQYIKARLTQVQNTLNQLRVLGKLPNLSDAELKTMLDVESIPMEKDDDTPPLLIDHWTRFLNGRSDRSRRIYDMTESKLRAYCNFNTLQFSNITVAWLRDFDRFMAETCSVNSRAIHMRNLRTIFNDAINEEVIDQNTYPFRRFKIKTEKTGKRSLSLEELKELKDYPCEEHQEKYRDIFFLIFYLIGINVIDLLNLKEIRNGRIEYIRSKTGRLYSIKVEPEAQAIFDKYKGKNYLLDVLDNYSNYRDFMHRLNMNLKQIGPVKIVDRKNGRPGKKEFDGLFPELSTYWARHTWATIAASLDIPKETIAASLGHGDSSVTDIYIDFDRKKIDKANRRVIDSLRENLI